MTYTLTADDTTQRARSLAYAKALAPQMFLRLGTQALFRHITIKDINGIVVAVYDRNGWVGNDDLD